MYLEKLLKYVLFFKFIWGRGCLYALAGTLQMTQGSLMDLIMGSYMFVVGVRFVLLGYLTAQKVAAVGRRTFSTSELRTKFRLANSDNKSGKLNLEHSLSKREKEIAFLYLDTGDVGTLSFDEFQAWFQRNDTVPIL